MSSATYTVDDSFAGVNPNFIPGRMRTERIGFASLPTG